MIIVFKSNHITYIVWLPMIVQNVKNRVDLNCFLDIIQKILRNDSFRKQQHIWASGYNKIMSYVLPPVADRHAHQHKKCTFFFTCQS